MYQPSIVAAGKTCYLLVVKPFSAYTCIIHNEIVLWTFNKTGAIFLFAAKILVVYVLPCIKLDIHTKRMYVRPIVSLPVIPEKNILYLFIAIHIDRPINQSL